MRRLHTEVPPPVLRSSGSRVRLPVITTRLMFWPAMTGGPPLVLVLLWKLSVESTGGCGRETRFRRRILSEQAEFSRSRCGCDGPVTDGAGGHAPERGARRARAGGAGNSASATVLG